jgi:hypothetical protein
MKNKFKRDKNRKNGRRWRGKYWCISGSGKSNFGRVVSSMTFGFLTVAYRLFTEEVLAKGAESFV